MSKKTADLDILFEQFYAANFPRVKNYAKLLTKSEEDAEDIAQNIFLKLWMRSELWEKEQEDMTGYLYTVTRNEIFNLFKHQRIEQQYEDKIISSQLIGELSDDDSSLLENLYYEEKLLLINMKLSELSPRRRQIFEMSRFDKLSHKEIAKLLQIPLRTVEDHVYKTILELRKTLIIVALFFFAPQFSFLNGDIYTGDFKLE